VTLAADLWRTTSDWQAFDILPLVAWVLDGLNQKGLVLYRETPMSLADRPGGRAYPASTLMPTAIRLSPDGWAAVGYPRVTVEVGSLDRHRAPGRAGDYTDYRHHHATALGGPITKEDFATHRALFPTHIHMYYEGDTVVSDTRAYTRVTPEVEASIIFARNELGVGGSHSDIAQYTGLPERTVRYVLTELPRLRRLHDGAEHSELSLKERIVVVLRELPEVKDAPDLVRVLGRGDSQHDVVHVLHSLHTQGKVDFKEGPRADSPQRIRLTKQGRGLAKDKPEVRDIGNGTVVLPADPITPQQEVGEYIASIDPELAQVAGLVPYTYPLLDALLERERGRMDSDIKAMKYVEAAEAIEQVDPDMARDLMAKAEALSAVMPSPIEREYLIYVSQHPSKDE
jgi:hypothetical protein